MTAVEFWSLSAFATTHSSRPLTEAALAYYEVLCDIDIFV